MARQPDLTTQTDRLLAEARCFVESECCAVCAVFEQGVLAGSLLGSPRDAGGDSLCSQD